MATRQDTDKKPPVRKTAPRAASEKTLFRKRSSAGSAHEAEGPVLPVEQLKQLHDIKPGAVDWVIQQTQIEAQHRREETSRVNGFILVEHFLGQLFALLIGLGGIAGGSWVAVNGHAWAGVAIAGIVMAGLAAIAFAGRSKRG